jgi:hypothetical protein
VGPPAVAIGLVLATVVALVTGSLRLPPGRGVGAARGSAGSLVSLTLCRWAAAGATAMVLAVPLFGGSSLSRGALVPAALWSWLGGALLLAVALGAVREARGLLPIPVRTGALALGALALAVGATALVVLV